MALVEPEVGIKLSRERLGEMIGTTGNDVTAARVLPEFEETLRQYSSIVAELRRIAGGK